MLADDNFNFDENGRKFSKRVKTTVGKGEIAHYEQFLLLPHRVFKRLVLKTRKNQGIVWERDKESNCAKSFEMVLKSIHRVYGPDKS